jgi:hypothetical protein
MTNKAPYHRTSSGWTDERRARHSAAIRIWSPWNTSTSPRTAEGKAISRCNALTHGATSRPAKDFMRNFRSYRQFLRLCWQKRAALLEKQNLEKQKNELLNVSPRVTSNRHFLTSFSPSTTFRPDNLCKQFAFSLTYAYIAPHECTPELSWLS